MSDDALNQAARALRMDREHGAMELALRAVEYAALFATERPERNLGTVARVLATARPSMAAIANAIALTLAPVVAGTKDRASLTDHVTRLREQWQEDGHRLNTTAKIHIPEAHIMTYSHSSTTRSALLARKDQLRSVIIPEGRPIDDGKALARILAEQGIPVTVITEAQMGRWVRETATLALLAAEAGAPMYSLTHTLKIAPYAEDRTV